MDRNLFPRTGIALRRACYLTAILNGLSASGVAQQAVVDQKPSTEPPLRYGPFDVLYSLQGGVVYDDNIYISTNKQSDVIWTIAPSMTLAAGDYREKQENLLTLSYTPTIFLFTDQSQNDALDHDARLAGQWHPGAWKFGLRQDYQNFSGGVVEVGNRVNRQIYNTQLSANYEISPRTALEFDGQQIISDYEHFISYNEWIAGGWVDYELTPLLKTGLGLTGGFVDVKDGTDQTYEQALGRVAYSLTELVDLRASAGVELRQFRSTQADRVNPVFTLGSTYRPLQNTTLKLDAYRRSQTSIVVQDQNYTVTGFSAGVRQIFFENYALNLAGGYENTDYESNSPTAPPATRKDKYYFARIGLEWSIREHFTVGAFYQYRNNDSTDLNHQFDNHQVGLNAIYHF